MVICSLCGCRCDASDTINGMCGDCWEDIRAVGLPFIKKPYDAEEEFDPYVYDGSMSMEDMKLMHHMMKKGNGDGKDTDGIGLGMQEQREGMEGTKDKVHTVVIRGVFYGRNRTFPGLNEYLHECARHPKAGARTKRQYQMVARNAVRAQIGQLKIHNPIILHYRFYEADKRRDKGNIFAFADKVFEDALQACGVIENDGWAQIENFTHEFYVDKENPRIEIDIKEAGDVTS